MSRSVTEAASRPAVEAFFRRPALQVAPELLGSVVSHGPVSLRLTEVEAYCGLDDPASHAYRGETPRTKVMFGPPGYVYVYFVYGVHWAMNLVCEHDGVAAACLLRGAEVIEGEDVARQRRGESTPSARLARGPGNLAAALGVTGTDSGRALWDGTLSWSPAPEPSAYEQGPRVGVAAAADRNWRFWIPGNPTVSAYRAHKRRHRGTRGR